MTRGREGLPRIPRRNANDFEDHDNMTSMCREYSRVDRGLRFYVHSVSLALLLAKHQHPRVGMNDDRPWGSVSPICDLTYHNH